MHRKLQASSEVDIPTWNFFTVDQLPHDVQGALLAPLADLHSQLCGLIYVAWLLALSRPQADDHDQ